ncbi:MAG: hypothetical protein ACLU0O_11795 [Collinsella sp.]
MLLNLNLLFDKQLSTTGLMICESNDLPRQRIPLRTAMRVVLDSDSYRREVLDHAVAFEHRYPYYIKGGFAAVVGVQVLLLCFRRCSKSTITARSSCWSSGLSRSLPSAAGLSISNISARASIPRCASRRFRTRTFAARCAKHTAAIPAARRMFGLNASERGQGREQPTSRLPHIGAHRKVQDADGVTTNETRGHRPLGKHSKGGEA